MQKKLPSFEAVFYGSVFQALIVVVRMMTMMVMVYMWQVQVIRTRTLWLDLMTANNTGNTIGEAHEQHKVQV